MIKHIFQTLLLLPFLLAIILYASDSAIGRSVFIVFAIAFVGFGIYQKWNDTDDGQHTN